jgi:hypothetical protein
MSLTTGLSIDLSIDLSVASMVMPTVIQQLGWPSLDIFREPNEEFSSKFLETVTGWDKVGRGYYQIDLSESYKTLGYYLKSRRH